jgi:hypothetical protein
MIYKDIICVGQDCFSGIHLAKDSADNVVVWINSE